jgi:hypothetical protein
MQSFSQAEKDCKTTLSLEAAFEKIENKPDTAVARNKNRTPGVVFVDYAGVSQFTYRIKSPNESYRIISYTVSAENQEGDIMESYGTGDTISGYPLNVIWQRKKNAHCFLPV